MQKFDTFWVNVKSSVVMDSSSSGSATTAATNQGGAGAMTTKDNQAVVITTNSNQAGVMTTKGKQARECEYINVSHGFDHIDFRNKTLNSIEVATPIHYFYSS